MADVPPVLLAYQQRFWADESPVIVWEKSRRIGASWACAGKAVELAATDTMDSWYLSYNEDAGKDFIRDAAKWAAWYQVAHSTVSLLEDFDDGDGESESILVNRIEFANGRRISALSSKPRSLRGKTGLAILDEAAFLTDLPEFLKAAMAFLTWNGRVIVLSTHDGAENPFNQLVLDIRSGKRDYSLITTTLDDALTDGLYKRICYTTGKAWSLEAETAWRDGLVRQHGVDADEELFCRPRRDGGTIFARDWFPIVDAAPARIVRTIRAYDFASTAPRKGKSSPDWTRGLKGSLLDDGGILIEDLVSLQGRPADVKRLVLDTAADVDGPRVEIAIWTDPGQAGVYQTDDLVTALRGYAVTPERAAKNKVDYARPVASFAKNGKVSMLRGSWNDDLLRELVAFPSAHAHDDTVDALSRLFLALSRVSFAVGYDAAPSSAQAHGWADDDDDHSLSRGAFL